MNYSVEDEPVLKSSELLAWRRANGQLPDFLCLMP